MTGIGIITTSCMGAVLHLILHQFCTTLPLAFAQQLDCKVFFRLTVVGLQFYLGYTVSFPFNSVQLRSINSMALQFNATCTEIQIV